MRPLFLAAAVLLPAAALAAEVPAGYYRFPAIHSDVIVFTAEGDLWKVDAGGGVARRLTSHPAQETHAAISPDGVSVAFSADYEGSTEVYVMPLAGGLPRRLTWEGRRAHVAGWTPAGEVLYGTRHFSTLPNVQLVRLDPASGRRQPVPLAQAAEGVYEPSGGPLFFARLHFQGSHTKRYKGGTVQNIWRFAEGEGEAAPLTADFPGTSREPMWWNGRVVFVSDRDGTMNLWSMTPSGTDLRQHTHHAGWDVKSPDHSGGRVVYQLGADLRSLHLESGEDRQLEISLASDFDQRREKWVDEPMEYLTAAHLSPEGDRLALTARGQVFVVPVKQGRRVEAGRPDGVRFRSARFLPAAKQPSEKAAPSTSLVVLSDESGEVELWRLDARGVEPREQLTEGGTELRFDSLPSPDGRRLAYVEHDHELWVLDLDSKRQTLVATSAFFGFQGLAWSPDSRWLAYGVPAENFLSQIQVYHVEDASTTALTSDRFHSFAPAWSPDGEWIYFLSDRHLVSLSRHPWGNYQPGPLLDRTTKIYHVALRQGLRSPFVPADELMTERSDDGDKPESQDEEEPKSKPNTTGKGKVTARPSLRVEIDRQGLAARLYEVPVPPGNYSALEMTAKALFWLSAETSVEGTLTLQVLAIGNDGPKVKSVVSKLDTYELSGDGKKLLILRKGKLYVADAKAAPLKDLGQFKVDLDDWAFPVDPREEWRQMFRDAWRLLRDYFYDPGMHGVDWPATLEKYLPLVDRVTDRAELSDLFGELTGELSALHHYVSGGDHREGPDQIRPASLGAVLERDDAAGGYRVASVYATDPDLPEESSPLSRPGVDVGAGDVLLAINGVSTLEVADPGDLLRHQAGRQVLLRVRGSESGKEREIIVRPLKPRQATELRYDAWEYGRRLMAEELGAGEIGYVHLRAMGGANYSEWARHYFPVFQRKGLIIDVRHNRGGNIDSWILGSLLRRPWMWWKPRVGQVYRNMQFAFGGHVVVLINERTASDGEAFAEGFRRLGLGKLIGTRTWGGEIWLSSSNVLVDRGIATAAEFGVYGPEGEWLIEGHGVEPDIEVDNLPHATYRGEDAQLAAAIEYLQQRIHEDPPIVPGAPPYPDKSFDPGGDGR